MSLIENYSLGASPLQKHKRQQSQDSGTFIEWSSEESSRENFVTVVAVEPLAGTFVTVLSIGNDAPANDAVKQFEDLLIYRLPGERLGFGLKFDGGANANETVSRLFIQSCATDSPASRTLASWGPLSAGDEILQIDEVDVSSMTRVECVTRLKESHVALKLRVKKGAEIIPPPVPPRKNKNGGRKSEDKRTNATISRPPEPLVYTDLVAEESAKKWETESDDTGSSMSTVIERFCSTSNSSLSDARSITSGDTTCPPSPIINVRSVDLDRVLEPFLQLEREFGANIEIENNNNNNKGHITFENLMAVGAKIPGTVEIPNGNNVRDEIVSPKFDTGFEVDTSELIQVDCDKNDHGAESLSNIIKKKRPPPPPPVVLSKCKSKVLTPPLVTENYDSEPNCNYLNVSSDAEKDVNNSQTIECDENSLNNKTNSSDNNNLAKSLVPDHLPRLIDFVPKDRIDIIIPNAIHLEPVAIANDHALKYDVEVGEVYEQNRDCDVYEQSEVQKRTKVKEIDKQEKCIEVYEHDEVQKVNKVNEQAKYIGDYEQNEVQKQNKVEGDDNQGKRTNAYEQNEVQNENILEEVREQEKDIEIGEQNEIDDKMKVVEVSDKNEVSKRHFDQKEAIDYSEESKIEESEEVVYERNLVIEALENEEVCDQIEVCEELNRELAHCCIENESDANSYDSVADFEKALLEERNLSPKSFSNNCRCIEPVLKPTSPIESSLDEIGMQSSQADYQPDRVEITRIGSAPTEGTNLACLAYHQLDQYCISPSVVPSPKTAHMPRDNSSKCELPATIENNQIVESTLECSSLLTDENTNMEIALTTRNCLPSVIDQKITPPPSFSRMPPDGHEFPSDYQEEPPKFSDYPTPVYSNYPSLDAKLEGVNKRSSYHPSWEEKIEYNPSLDKKIEYRSSLGEKIEYHPSSDERVEYQPSLDNKIEYRPSLGEVIEYHASSDKRVEYHPSLDNKIEYLPSLDNKKPDYYPSSDEKIEYHPSLDAKIEGINKHSSYHPSLDLSNYHPSSEAKIEAVNKRVNYPSLDSKLEGNTKQPSYYHPSLDSIIDSEDSNSIADMDVYRKYSTASCPNEKRELLDFELGKKLARSSSEQERPKYANATRRSNAWRADEKSERSVKDKIAMFSNGGPPITSSVTPGKKTSANRREDFVAKSVVTYRPTEISDKGDIMEYNCDPPSDYMSRARSSIDLTISSSPSSAYSSCSPDSSLSPMSSPSYTIGESSTLPRKCKVQKSENNHVTLSRATSFAGAANLHSRSQSMVDFHGARSHHAQACEDVKRGADPLNALLEQRRRTMSRLRGLVIPEKVMENAPNDSKQNIICDLPEIKSKEATPRSELKRNINKIDNNRRSANPEDYTWKFPLSMGSGVSDLPKYSPAFKRKSLAVYGSGNSSSTTSSVSSYSSLSSSREELSISSVNDKNKSTSSKPPRVYSNDTAAQLKTFRFKRDDSKDDIIRPDEFASDFCGKKSDSDSDSAVSSSRSSMGAEFSPPQSPTPEYFTEIAPRPNVPSRCSSASSVTLTRTLSSETSLSISSSTSTITSGSGFQASCSDISSGDNCRRVLKPESAEALNRNCVLTSAKRSSGITITDEDVKSVAEKKVVSSEKPKLNGWRDSSEEGDNYLGGKINREERFLASNFNRQERYLRSKIGRSEQDEFPVDKIFNREDIKKFSVSKIQSADSNAFQDNKIIPNESGEFQANKINSSEKSNDFQANKIISCEETRGIRANKIDRKESNELQFNEAITEERILKNKINRQESVEFSTNTIKREVESEKYLASKPNGDITKREESRSPNSNVNKSNFSAGEFKENVNENKIISSAKTSPPAIKPKPTTYYKTENNDNPPTPENDKFGAIFQNEKPKLKNSIFSNVANRSSISVNDIRKNFEKCDSTVAPNFVIKNITKCSSDVSENHKRMSSLDSTASDESYILTSSSSNFGSVSDLLKEQFGSISSLASSTSLISQQELQQLIDDAEETAARNSENSEVMVVILHRDTSTSSVGITLAGGADYEAKDITVHKVLTGSPADRDGRILKGDRVLSINGRCTKGITHREALCILKAPRPEVVLVISRHRTSSASEATSNDVRIVNNNSRIPIIVENTSTEKVNENKTGENITVCLVKDGGGLGFSLEGGKDSPLGDLPLSVKKIFTGGCAEKSGLLAAGDELLTINNVDVTTMSRTEAWNMMKKLTGGQVNLTIRRLAC